MSIDELPVDGGGLTAIVKKYSGYITVYQLSYTTASPVCHFDEMVDDLALMSHSLLGVVIMFKHNNINIRKLREICTHTVIIGPRLQQFSLS